MVLLLRSRSRSYSNLSVATEELNRPSSPMPYEYARLPYEDEDDDIPYLDEINGQTKPISSNASCKLSSQSHWDYGSLIADIDLVVGLWVILVFSLAGVLYLWSISWILSTNSPYLQIGHDKTLDKRRLSKSVKTAAVLYGIVVLVCIALLWSHARVRKLLDKREKE